MSGRRPSWARAQAANLITVAALVPVLVVLGPGGRAWLPLALILVDAIDSLDGIVARWLGTSSPFGAQLDRTCDALAHGTLVAVVGVGLPGPWAALTMPALVAIVVRLSRQSQGTSPRQGSSSNELLRHLYVCLVAVEWGLPAVPWIPLMLGLHAVTLLWPRPLRLLLRRRARTNAGVLLFYAFLALPLGWSPLVVPVAIAVVGTWGWSLLDALSRRD